MKRIVVTPATDPAKLRVLAAALEPLKHTFDEWRWWLVWGSGEAEVQALAAELGVAVDSFPGPAGCAARYHRLCVTDGVVYVRLDEDIASLAPDFVNALVAAATAPGVMVAHANVGSDPLVQAAIRDGATDPVTTLALGMQAYAWNGRHFALFGGYVSTEPRSLLRDAPSPYKMRAVIAVDARCSAAVGDVVEPVQSVVAETVPVPPPVPAADAESSTVTPVASLVEPPPAPKKRRVTRRTVVNAA